MTDPMPMPNPMPSIPWTSRRHRVPLACAAILLMVGLAAAPALAQRNDTQELLNRMQRLETEIQTLSREVYRGGGRPAAGGTGAPSGLPSSVAGDIEVRLQRMESDMQQLTGRYEETAFAVSQLRDRLEKLAADIDFRLTRLEQGQSGGGGGLPGPATAAAGEPGTTGGNTGGNAPSGGTAAAGPTAVAPQPDVAAPPAQLPTGSAQEQYDFAFNLIRMADYAGAEQAFGQFLKQHPNHSLSANAQYWLAETLYVRNKFKEAAVAFAEGYQKFPKSSKAPDSLLKLAMSLGAIDARDDACIALRTLDTEYRDAQATIKRRADMEKNRLKCR